MTDGELRLAMRHQGWWELTLVAAQRTTVLGCDFLGPIAEGMLARLSAPGEAAGEREGRPVHWVLSLWEQHHSVYCALERGDRLLYFQDVRGQVIWRDRLSPAHLYRWVAVLGTARAR